MATFRIVSSQATLLKPSYKQSSSLSFDSVIQISKGTSLPIAAYKEAPEGHILITLQPPVQYNGKNTYFVFKSHFTGWPEDRPTTPPLGGGKGFKLTLEQLARIYTHTPKKRLELFIEPLNITFERYGIDTPLKAAHFLAQAAVESGELKWLREIWGPTPQQRTYVGRMGIRTLAEAYKYRGAGIFQYTGLHNLQDLSKTLGIDFVSNPNLLTNPLYACLSAGVYWQSRNLSKFAEQDKVAIVTRLINGGYTHLEERRRYLDKAKKVLGVN